MIIFFTKNKMNKLTVLFISLLALFIFSGTSFSMPEKLWISSINAKLKSEKSSSSKTVANLKIGTELSVIAFEKRWYNVETKNGEIGWIYRGKVSESKPDAPGDEEEGGLGGILDNIAGSNIQANASDTSRSIRGLSPEAEEYSEQTGKPQEVLTALDSVLELKVHNDEIEQFLKNGEIGEYAK